MTFAISWISWSLRCKVRLQVMDMPSRLTFYILDGRMRLTLCSLCMSCCSRDGLRGNDGIHANDLNWPLVNLRKVLMLILMDNPLIPNFYSMQMNRPLIDWCFGTFINFHGRFDRDNWSITTMACNLWNWRLTWWTPLGVGGPWICGSGRCARGHLEWGRFIMFILSGR